MQKSNLNLLALSAIALLCLLIQGCAQMREAQNWNAQSATCRSCHSSEAVAGARDFGPIYAERKTHHPVGGGYPQADEKYKQPDGRVGEVAFFDKNGNSQPDSDEIQLFGEKGVMTVKCATCHKEHGGATAAVSTPGGSNLRISNENSALCVICHNI